MQGFTTIHAGSGRQALTRLRFICQLSDSSSELPLSALNSLVSESIDLVVHSVRTPAGPQVAEVVAVDDLAAGVESSAFTTTEVFRRPRRDAPLEWTGNVPTRLVSRLESMGADILGGLGRDGAPWRTF